MAARHALLVFSKPPLPGLVKTRLTTGRGGALTPEQAAGFFKHCLWDVVGLSCAALDELGARCGADCAFDLAVSTTPPEQAAFMRATLDAGGTLTRPALLLADEGEAFDERLEAAFQALFARGYEMVMAIGADAPTMPQTHIVEAFERLRGFREHEGADGLVLAPCQECGLALVGCGSGTPISQRGMYYDPAGRCALDLFCARVEQAGIPFACLPCVCDVDEMDDLAHTLSLARALRAAARTQQGLYVPINVLRWAQANGM